MTKNIAKSISDKNIDATIRGSLAASNVLKQLKESYPKISRATYIHGKGHEFIISSVGIDEGNTLKEKLNIAVHCIDFMKKLKKNSENSYTFICKTWRLRQKRRNQPVTG